MPDALSLLDRDWRMYCASRTADGALRRWRQRDAVPAVRDMDALLRATQDREDPDARDRLVYRLVVLASVDRDACRVVLQTVRPGLSRVAWTYRPWCGWEDAASMAVAAAIERIVTYPATRVARPAANIVADVHNRLHRARAREARLERSLGAQASLVEVSRVAAIDAPSASDELKEIVQDALGTRRFSDREAGLVLDQRIRDVPTHQLAAERGQRPGTVRLHRRLAERRLRLVTRSALGLCPEIA